MNRYRKLLAIALSALLVTEPNLTVLTAEGIDPITEEGTSDTFDNTGADEPEAPADETQADYSDTVEWEVVTDPQSEDAAEESGEPESAAEYVMLSAESGDYRVDLSCGPETGIPFDAELKMRVLEAGTNEYNDYVKQIRESLDENVSVTDALLFDISIMCGDTEIQPEAPVDVHISILPAEVKAADEVKAIHFAAEGTETSPVEIEDLDVVEDDGTIESVAFTADGFSVYAIIWTVIEKNILASDGHNYKITVTYGTETGIPENADLSAEEILPGENGDVNAASAYEEYVSKTENALGMEQGSADYIRLFDISIVDRDDHNVKYQPKEGTSVEVQIALADMGNDPDPVVVHFGENENAVRLENTVDGDTVFFETDSFSVFAVAVFGDIVERTPYMNIRVHSSVPMITALKSADDSLFQGRDVVEAYEVIPHVSLAQVTLKITDLPEHSQNEVFELCVLKDGIVSSLGEAVSDKVFSFRADEADAFALVKSQAISRTLTGEYGVSLSGDFPEGAHVSVSETEPVELDGSHPEISFAYDITIYDSNNNEWQPAAGESVECFIPCNGTQEELEAYYWVVLHTSDGVTEQLYDAAPVEGGIRFTTASFSTFTLCAQVTGKSLIGSSTVHFIDHQGNEIQGAVTGTINYEYRVPYDMWDYASQLDPSIAEDYEFSRVYLQLTGMQKDFRYLYLGPNSDAGYSGSSYKIYFFMNSIDECRTGGTYYGTWYTFSAGTKWSDPVYIVFDHVEDVSFRKVNDDGDPVEGAGFTLYTDSNCINVFTYNDSEVTATSDANGTVDFGRIPYGTYYMKETTTPSGFKESGKVYTVTVNGKTSIPDIVNEDNDGSIIVTETKTVNITKEWSDGQSSHSNDSVTVKLFNEGSEAKSVTLNQANNWKQSVDDLDPTASYMISETSVISDGEDVTSGWIPTITPTAASTSTGYYQTDVFRQGEQYVIAFGGNTALSSGASDFRYFGTAPVKIEGNQVTSDVSNNILWQAESVSDDGVITLKNVSNNRYLNYPYSSSTSQWGLTAAVPQFIRYKKNGSFVQIYYRQNMNDAPATYLNGTSTSTGSGTNFTLFKKVNVNVENITVTNRPAEYPVMMKKLEYSSDNAIPGTTFDLYTREGYEASPSTPLYTGLTSGEDGYLTKDGSTHIQLLADTYYLVEKQAAAGYVNLAQPVIFTISRGGRFTAKSTDQEFTDYTYASTVTEGETTYPLLKVPNQKKITLTFKAEEGVDKVQYVSGDYLEISGDGTKELTVVVAEVTGTSISVKGIAEDGNVVNGWTINDETKKLTAEAAISTAIKDDKNASNIWTNRTYHVWSETEKKVNVTKEVKVLGTVSLDDIDTTAYFVLWDHAANRNVLDENGNILIKQIPIVNGIPQGPVTFDGLTSGTYSVWEVDKDGNDLAAGMVVIGDDIAVSKIETRHGDDTGNQAVVNDKKTTDGVTVINTYNHESDVVNWTIKKEWYMEKNTVNQRDKASTPTSEYPIPAEATSTLVLYRKDDMDTPLRTIVLDGTADTEGETAAWNATFADIPIKDSEGNRIEYVVKETAFTPEKSNEGLYIYPYTAETNHDGGTIRNAVIYGNIQIFKQIAIQPDDMDISQYIGKLAIEVTGPHHFEETYSFTAADQYKLELTTEDLPAGTYHVKEVNYENLIPDRKWNPTGSWIKASIMPADQSDQQEIERQGETETDVQIGTKGSSEDTVEVEIRNDYTNYDIKATKVWNDSEQSHPEVELTLYKADDSGDKTPVGETKTIPADASGEDLTVVWEQIDQQYSYTVEETPLYGYTAEVSGGALDGFTVTNTPKQQSQLTIVKAVTGTDQANQKTYKVKVIPEGFPEETQIIELKPVGGEDSKTISVPYGTYTIEELLTDAEEPSYTIDIDDYDRTTTIAMGEGSGEETVSRMVDIQSENAVVKVTNSYIRKTTDVSFIKADGRDHEITLSAAFQIEYSHDNVNYSTIDNDRVPGVADSVFTISETGMILPLMDGYYRLTEKTAPDGYHMTGMNIVFSVTKGEISLMNASECEEYAAELEAGNNTIGLELYNYEKVPVSIWKTDPDRKTITGGASFVLYKASNFDDAADTPIEKDETVASGTTGKNGILLLGELESGEYRLVETKTPDGYLRLKHAIKITVSENGSISAAQEGEESDIAYKGNKDWVPGQDDKTAQIRIWNQSESVPPSTNEPIRPYYIRVVPNTYDGGLMRFVWMNAISLILAAACGIILRRYR